MGERPAGLARQGEHAVAVTGDTLIVLRRHRRGAAEQVIVEMQNVADQIFLMELKLDQSFEVLQFLREELVQAGAPGVGPTG